MRKRLQKLERDTNEIQTHKGSYIYSTFGSVPDELCNNQISVQNPIEFPNISVQEADKSDRVDNNYILNKNLILATHFDQTSK
jgi:hypothetical protein